MDKLRRRAHFRRWADAWGRDGQGPFWVAFVVGTTLVVLALALGWVLGVRSAQGPPLSESPPAVTQPSQP